MKALVLHGIGELRYEEIPVPVPGPGEVLVKVSACGVCGSDLPRIFEKGAYRFPIVCGHEFSGIIAECGTSVNDLLPGMRVVVFPLIWCGRCVACEKGYYAQCRSYDYLGSRCNGAFAEYVAAPRKNILPVPENVPLEIAAMTEPAAVALHAINRAGNIKTGETTAIFGAGPIGLMTAQWAEISGAGKVVLFDIAADKLALARQLGFRYCFNPLESAPREVIMDITAGLGADVAVEAAGVAASLQHCLAVAGLRGRVVLLGNPAGDVLLPASLLSQAMRNEIALYGAWNSMFSASGGMDEWRVVVQSMAASALSLQPLISHRVSLGNALGMLHAMHDKSVAFTKVIIQPSID